MSVGDLQKVHEYHQKGIKPTRFKISSIVYSDKNISTPISFNLNFCELTLYPIEKSKHKDYLEGYMPAFICVVITDADTHKGGGNFDIHEALDRVFPLLGFDYRLPMEYELWEEFDEQWLETPCAWGSGSMQTTYQKSPNPRIQEIVKAYEFLSQKTDKRSKKSISIRKKLKEAIDLQNISKRYSFMSYYGVLEVISDDLCANQDCPSDDNVANEMAKYALANKGSQRTKIYFLMRAIQNDFDIDECMKLPDIRNDIAHGKVDVDPKSFELCRKLAFWVSEEYALRLANNA